MTVLDQPAIDPHDRAVRWRQLVDLVARAGSQADNPLVEQALHLIRSDGELVDETLRAAAARAVAALPLPYELVALFAADTMAVAAPVLAAARLKREDWQKLLGVADEETRHFILTLHPDLPPPSPGEPALEEPHVERPEEPHVEPPEAPPAPQVPSISDVVARIERLRRGRAQATAGAGEAAATAAGAPTLFRWECIPSGEIVWVEGAPRGPLIGRSIARAEEGEGVEQEVE